MLLHATQESTYHVLEQGVMSFTNLLCHIITFPGMIDVMTMSYDINLKCYKTVMSVLIPQDELKLS